MELKNKVTHHFLAPDAWTYPNLKLSLIASYTLCVNISQKKVRWNNQVVGGDTCQSLTHTKFPKTLKMWFTNTPASEI